MNQAVPSGAHWKKVQFTANDMNRIYVSAQVKTDH
jgi:hypothetical protein